ncbi:MAG: redoxin domain-containing protein [Methanoregulaceae archaeon]|nr:redoxin domain-containing protein [Methanoregulaceae archaeon]
MEVVSRPIIRPPEHAPNFSIKDQYSRTFDLLEQMGKRVLLSFHPLAWTEFCAAQMISLEENQKKFGSLNTVAVGISVDSVACKKAWADHMKIEDTLILADFWPHGKVAQSYGIFRDTNGFSERANIILDENQDVVFVKVYPVHSVPDIAEVVRFIEGMG